MRDITSPTTYAAEVQTIIDAGGTITESFRNTINRWENYTNNNHTMQHELNTAILDPDSTPEHLHHLRILAEAEAAGNPVTQATVRNEASAHVLAALHVEYRSVAAANYNTIRERFNTKAGELVKALETTDSETSAEQIVKANAKERGAWSDGPALAVELTTLLATLHTAATLTGYSPHASRLDSTLIGLSINASGLHRRRVWEAWNNNTSRGGRWRELWNLGATIEAPALDDAKPYREPAPMETRAEHTGTGIRQYAHDPEDDNHAGDRNQLRNTAAEAGITAIDYDDTNSAVTVR